MSNSFGPPHVPLVVAPPTPSERVTEADRAFGGFRGDIEGLRAIAVGLVVLAHARVSGLGGGYVGVDVFFVISGFLITALFVTELETEADIRSAIAHFYARRIRRILPMASVVVLTTVVAAYAVLGSLAGRSTALDGRWAALFAANVRSIRLGTDYFATDLPASALQHYWSLAVEEQFYVVWPVVLIGLWLVGQRSVYRLRALQIGVTATVIGSLIWSISQTGSDPTTAYFSPFTRAWELGIGALVAMFAVSIGRIAESFRTIASWVGLGAIVASAVVFDGTTAFPGSAAILPVGGCALVLAGGIGGARNGAGRILDSVVLRRLGAWSFSIYLWHWPILIIAAQRSATPLSAATRVVCVVATVAISAVTYTLIERPIRSSGWLTGNRRRDATSSGRGGLLPRSIAVAVPLVVCSISVAAIVQQRAQTSIDAAAANTRTTAHGSFGDTTTTSTPSGTTTPSVPGPTTTTRPLTTAQYHARVVQLSSQVASAVAAGAQVHSVANDVAPPVLALLRQGKDQRYYDCLSVETETVLQPCTFGDPAGTATMVVLGDSHVSEWMPALDLVAQQRALKIVMYSKRGCPPVFVDVVQAAGRAPYPECTTWRTAAFAATIGAKPKLIVLAFSPTPGLDSQIARWSDGVKSAVEALAASHATVINIGDQPRLVEDPSACLSRPSVDPQSCHARFDKTTFGERFRDADRTAVLAAGGRFIDVEPWFCVSATNCPAIIDGQIVYHDKHHITSQYAIDLVPLLGASIDELTH